MKAVIAIDSLKGSLSSMEAGYAIADGIRRVHGQDAEIVVRPLADGGEGTVEALVSGMSGVTQNVMVTGPLGIPVNCEYGIIESSHTAVIEMSGAAGITLVPDEKRNPLYTTTYGVGEVIKDAIAKGCRRFIVGIGGSATNDGGVGMLQALGYGFLNKEGKQVPFGARGLEVLEEITDEYVLPELAECEFRVACDVTNILCGENGCSAGTVYGASSASLAATPWQKITQPVPGSAQSIGSFSNGCIVGADTLPIQSEHYQVMRTDQRRYFGHPDLVMFIQRLSSQVSNLGMGTVLIGDMGMPAGGRFNGGHASHQTGLDVDIFLQLPKTRWTSAQLLRPQALDLVSRDGKHVVSTLWKPEIFSLIKLAAQDKDVTRIFVNPAIKQQLCFDAGTDRDWLRKVRPWFQHRAHMHVRLRCPADSLECEDQPLPPPGDGCGAELQSWFEPPKPGTTKPEKKTPPPLPPSCQALLDEHVI